MHIMPPHTIHTPHRVSHSTIHITTFILHTLDASDFTSHPTISPLYNHTTLHNPTLHHFTTTHSTSTFHASKVPPSPSLSATLRVSPGCLLPVLMLNAAASLKPAFDRSYYFSIIIYYYNMCG